MNDSFEALFRTDYMPHGHCYWWSPEILWLNVISDVLIAFAYFSIPVAIYYFVKKRQGLEFKGVFILFSLFILLCGITHLISIVVIWHGTYGIHGIVKMLTAMVSCVTAYVVYRSIPAALLIPSQSELTQAFEEANSEKLTRVQLENQKKQDLLLRESTENAHIGILVVDETGKILVANSAVCDIFEYEKDELENSNVSKIVSSDVIGKHHILMRQFFNAPEINKNMAAGRLVYGLTKLGKRVPIEIVLRHRVQSQGPVVYASITDISQRVAAQEALAASEKTTRNIINSLPVGLHVFQLINDELIFKGFNPAADRILGIDNASLIGKPLKQAFPDIAIGDIDFKYREVLRTGNTRVNDIVVYNDGVINATFLIHTFQTTPNTIITLFQDVTVQKKAEQEVIEKEQFIRKAFDSSISAVYIYNLKTGKTEFINESYTRLTGITLTYLNNMGEQAYFEHVHPDDLEEFKRFIKQLREQSNDSQSTELAEFGSDTLEYRFKHRNGYWIWCLGQNTVFEREKDGSVSKIMGSFIDISAIKSMQQNLMELKDTAEKANAIKGEFLANMSHEIRTPMNAILGLTQLVLEMDLGRKQREYLSKIMISSTSLLNILNDILDYSKMEAGKLNIVNEVFDLGLIVENVAGLFELLADEKQIELLVDFPIDIPRYFIGDQLRITQVLNNIVGNAVKFTEKGHVTISVRAKEVEGDGRYALSFRVEDSGIGMSQQQVETIFYAFSQADSSISRVYGGTGLGMSISQGLAAEMGGKINVASQLGSGSVFTFELHLLAVEDELCQSQLLPKPMRVLIVSHNNQRQLAMENILRQWQFNVSVQGPDKSRLVDSLTQSVVDNEPIELLIVDVNFTDVAGNAWIEELHLLKQQAIVPAKLYLIWVISSGEKPIQRNLPAYVQFIEKPVFSSKLQSTLLSIQGHQLDKNSRALATKATQVPNGSLASKHILLVEDNVTNQLVALEILKRFNAQVVVANNGKEAIDIFAQQTFDLILMDLQMPVLDGYAATKAIRKSDKGKDIPIIAMSAAVMNDDLEKVATSGMNDHIPKPVDIQHLVNVLEKWIKFEHTSKPNVFIDVTQNAKIEQSSDDNLIIINKLQDLGFAVTDALNRLADDDSLYIKLLTSFCIDHQSTADTLLEWEQKKALQEIKLIAHTIKGLAASIGAQTLNKEAVRVESSIEADIAIDIQSFAAVLKNTLMQVNQVLPANVEHEQSIELTESERFEYRIENLIELLESGKLLSEHEVSCFKQVLQETLDSQLHRDTFTAISRLDYTAALALLAGQ